MQIIFMSINRIFEGIHLYYAHKPTVLLHPLVQLIPSLWFCRPGHLVLHSINLCLGQMALTVCWSVVVVFFFLGGGGHLSWKTNDGPIKHKPDGMCHVSKWNPTCSCHQFTFSKSHRHTWVDPKSSRLHNTTNGLKYIKKTRNYTN